MAGINITEKAVDILVNGSQQASYEQRVNSSDYNISTSQNLQWSQVKTWSMDLVNETDTIYNPSYYNLFYLHIDFTEDSANQSDSSDIEILANGDLVGNVSPGNTGELSATASKLEARGSDISNTEFTITLEEASNLDIFFDKAGFERYKIQPTFTVTQS